MRRGMRLGHLISTHVFVQQGQERMRDSLTRQERGTRSAFLSSGLLPAKENHMLCASTMPSLVHFRRLAVILVTLTAGTAGLGVFRLVAAEIDFSTYFGGPSGDTINAVAVAPDGNLVVVGTSSSESVMGVLTQEGCNSFGNCGQGDIFVLRVSPDGSQILEGGSRIGGSSFDEATGVAIGADGSIYVTGFTRSGDFPTVAAHQSELGDGATDPSQEQPPRDAVVVKLTADATTIVYSTYLGGPGNDEAFDIAVNPQGRVMIVGATDGDFAVTEFGFDFTYNGGRTDGFVALFLENGVQYSGFYLGGDREDTAQGAAVDAQGFFYVGGDTEGGFPTTTGVYEENRIGSVDGWVAKIDPTKIGLNMLVFSTYLGGTGPDHIFGLEIGPDGNIYATGDTASSDLPVTDFAFQRECGCDLSPESGADAWVGKISANGRALVYLSYLGGGGADTGKRVDVDSFGRAYVTGAARPGFPVPPENSFIDIKGDAFIAVVSATGRTLQSSRTLGGAEGGGFLLEPLDLGRSIAVDEGGCVYAGGLSWSSNFPTTSGALLEEPADDGSVGYFDGWLVKQARGDLHSVSDALTREVEAGPFLEPEDVRLLAREIELAVLAAERGDLDEFFDALRRFAIAVETVVDERRLTPSAAEAWLDLLSEMTLQLEKSLPAIILRRGDCNDDGDADISDAVCTLNALFTNTGSEPICQAALNVNGDAGVDISDPIALLNFLFVADSAPPVAPFPWCGPTTLDADGAVGCATRPKSCEF